MIDRQKLKYMATDLVTDPDDYISALRHNIDRYIADKDITLNDVAEAADMSVSTLKTFLYGNAKDCHLSTAVKLARVFEVTLDELVGCGTMPEETKKSIQLTRQMPESYTHFIRWMINFQYDMYNTRQYIKDSVEVMDAELREDGTFKTSNIFENVDISHISKERRTKIFMGIKLPGNNYEPIYMKSNIILLANDRNPLEDEKVVVCVDDALWIFKAKYVRENGEKLLKYYSIRDGIYRTDASAVHTMGYIVEVI